MDTSAIMERVRKGFARFSAFLKKMIPNRPAVFTLATKDHWRDAGTWLRYTLFGGLLPFWGTALILLFLQRAQPFKAYFANGELAVFCAGLLASSIPVMRRRVKDAPVEHPEWFTFLALMCIAVILLLFASVTITRQVNRGGVTTPILILNEHAILNTSFVLFAVSILMGFSVELINNVRMTPKDVQASEMQREAGLAEKFGDALKAQP